MSMKVYDPKKVTLIFDGEVITGMADDSMIKAEKSEDSMIPHVGVKGEVSVAVNGDNTGKITISLASTSPHNRTLTQKASSKTVAAISIVDMNEGGVSVSGSEAVIIKPPDVTYGKEVANQEVVFFVADYTVS